MRQNTESSRRRSTDCKVVARDDTECIVRRLTEVGSEGKSQICVQGHPSTSVAIHSNLFTFSCLCPLLVHRDVLASMGSQHILLVFVMVFPHDSLLWSL